MNDKLVLRPSPTKTADLAYEAQIRGLIDGNTKASIGSSHKVRPCDAKQPSNRQTKLAPILVIRAPWHETNDDSLVSLTIGIDGAKGDVRVAKSTGLVSRSKFQIERSCIGSARNDARGVRVRVRVIAGVSTCRQKEPQAYKEPSF